jgi:hypothetical protein
VAGSPFVLVKPASPFIPSDFGLSSVVDWQVPDGNVGERWQMGVKWEPTCITGAATTLSPCVTGDVIDTPAKAPTFANVVRGARPFTVYSEIDCSPVGWEQLAVERAAKGLTQGEQWQVERTFQTGVAAGFTNIVLPNLTTTGPVFDSLDTTILLQPASTVISGAAIDVVEGLGRLVQAISGNCYAGGRPIIHVPLHIGEELVAEGLVERVSGPNGPMLKTKTGYPVGVGAGYNQAAGPGGTTAPTGTGWMFATGAIFGYRGQLRILGTTSEALDRSENTLKRIAERQVLLGWDCCLAAVLVTLGGELAGLYGTAGPAT